LRVIKGLKNAPAGRSYLSGEGRLAHEQARD